MCYYLSTSDIKKKKKTIPGPFERVACHLTEVMGLQLGYWDELAQIERDDALVTTLSHQPIQQLHLSLQAALHGVGGTSSAPQPVPPSPVSPRGLHQTQTGNRPQAVGSWSYYLNYLLHTSSSGPKAESQV